MDRWIDSQTNKFAGPLAQRRVRSLDVCLVCFNVLSSKSYFVYSIFDLWKDILDVVYRTSPRTSNGKPVRENASRTTPATKMERISVRGGQFFCQVLFSVIICFLRVRQTPRLWTTARFRESILPKWTREQDFQSRFARNTHHSNIFLLDICDAITFLLWPSCHQAVSKLHFFRVLPFEFTQL